MITKSPLSKSNGGVPQYVGDSNLSFNTAAMEARRRDSDAVPAGWEHKDGDVVPRNPQYSLITIRRDTPPPLIFPPTNHENLHISIFPSPSDSSHDSETSSPWSSLASAHSPVVKSAVRITPVEIWFTKVSGLMRFVWGYLVKWRGEILNLRTVVFVAAVVYFRERRRSRSNADAVQLRDEKIKKLFDQISQMNQILLYSHRAKRFDLI